MKNINKIRERNLLQLLIEEKKITREQLELIREDQQTTGELIVEIVLKNEYVAERDLAKCLVKHYNLPFLYPEDYPINQDMKTLIEAPYLHAKKVYPLDVFGNVVVMVTSGNIFEELIRDIESKTEKEAFFFVAQHNALKRVLEDDFSLEELATEVSSRMDELFGVS